MLGSLIKFHILFHCLLDGGQFSVDTVTTIFPPGPQKIRQAWVEARDFSSRVIRDAIVE